MPQSLPPLTWMRAFESAARHLSFTKAAGELNLTQSAISQHVRSLETRFGCDLFVRQHKRLHLTDQGRRLLPKATKALAGLYDVVRTFDVVSPVERLSVVASPSVARALIIPNLHSFLDANPGVVPRLSTRTWPDEFSGIEADVEIRFDTAQSARRGGKLLGRQTMQVVAAPDFLDRAQTRITAPVDCTMLPTIGVLGTADTWESWADTHGFAWSSEPIALVEAHGLAVEMAAAGVGLAYTNSLIAAPYVNRGELCVLFNSQATATDGYFLLARNDGASAAARAFKAWLEALVDGPGLETA